MLTFPYKICKCLTQRSLDLLLTFFWSTQLKKMLRRILIIILYLKESILLFHWVLLFALYFLLYILTLCVIKSSHLSTLVVIFSNTKNRPMHLLVNYSLQWDISKESYLNIIYNHYNDLYTIYNPKHTNKILHRTR
jgi:DNA integrity scanning protein DisA with diadenylate cyclase activity